MTCSDQARLLLRKASQDLAVLDKLIDDPSIDDASLWFRYDDLPFEDIPDRHSWPPLLHRLLAEVQGLIDAGGSPGPVSTP